jgi:2-polyprenyl-6-methoxyphenol hydroxylase-like FAD-dependent oxidoreductase
MEPGTLTVSQQGSTPVRTVWYLRIEDLAARTMVEQSSLQPIALSKTLAEGQYRVIVWHRACEKTCPAHGEQGLGPLEQVCGAKVTVAAATTVRAVAVVGADGSCAIKVTT